MRNKWLNPNRTKDHNIVILDFLYSQSSLYMRKIEIFLPFCERMIYAPKVAISPINTAQTSSYTHRESHGLNL